MGTGRSQIIKKCLLHRSRIIYQFTFFFLILQRKHTTSLKMPSTSLVSSFDTNSVSSYSGGNNLKWSSKIYSPRMLVEDFAMTYKMPIIVRAVKDYKGVNMVETVDKYQVNLKRYRTVHSHTTSRFCFNLIMYVLIINTECIISKETVDDVIIPKTIDGVITGRTIKHVNHRRCHWSSADRRYDTDR